MNIVFMGTPDFAVSALDALAGDSSGRFAVKLVLTRPDSVSGRGKTPLPSPVRLAAERHGITVLMPKSFYAVDDAGMADDGAGGAAGIGLAAAENGADGASGVAAEDGVGGADCTGVGSGTGSAAVGGGTAVPRRRIPDAGLLDQIAAACPDIIVVAAYGLLLPKQLLDLPRACCVNIHASLLPRWRGAAPIQRAILAGDQQTGVSIMRMDEGLDTGAVCATGAVAVGGKRLELLTAELAALGSRLLLAELPRIADGTAPWVEQDGSLACYAEKIGKRELAISPALSVEQNLRRVLASSPQAPARCLIAGRPVTLLDARIATGLDADHAPATAFLSGKRLLLATADGYLQPLSLKPDGKRQMDAAAFASGVRELVRPGDCPASWSAIDGGSA